MTSTELKDLVKSHFNLVEANVVEETTENVTEEVFGSLKDENGAFTIEFPGDSLQIGDKVTVVTSENQRMDAPDGTHRLEDGTEIVTKDSVVTEIKGADGEKALAEEEVKEEMAEETEEEMETEDKEEMEEKVEEEKMEIEDVVKAIVAEVKDEMGKLRDEMKAMEEKVSKMEAAPAAEPTRTSTGKKMGAAPKRGFKAFNVEESLNADRIKMALAELKNKK